MERIARRIVVVVAGAAAAFLFGLPPAALSTHVVNAPLLPDLIVKEPERLSVLKIQNQRRLRFDNEVGNAHTGPFELVAEGVESDCDGDGTVATGERRVSQRVYTDVNGNGFFERETDTVFTDTPAGCVVYHDEPTHHHAHYSDFASYSLVRPSDGVTVAGSSKVTFCIADVWRFRGSLAGSPESRHYISCSDLTQGLSAGWSDEYPYTTAGQYIDLDPGGKYIGDGDYCLVSVADPRDLVSETDNTNDGASVEIRLSRRGKKVQTFPGTSCGSVPPESW
jgi:hypothetical protein